MPGAVVFAVSATGLARVHCCRQRRSASPVPKPLTNGSLRMLTYSILPRRRLEGYKQSSGASHATRGMPMRGHGGPADFAPARQRNSLQLMFCGFDWKQVEWMGQFDETFA